MSRTVTISAGRPNREGDEKDFSGDDGTYPVILLAISDEITEKSTVPDGKKETWSYRIWTMALDTDDEHQGEVIDVRASSTSTSPKSKQFGLIAAFAGKVPPIGTEVDLDRLIGRTALASILTNENNFPYVDKLLAMPQGRQQAAAPAPATEPAAEPPRGRAPRPAQAAPEPVAAAAASDDLPF